MVDYPPAIQQRAAEIQALTSSALLEGFMADYNVLRQQARACAAGGARPP